LGFEIESIAAKWVKPAINSRTKAIRHTVRQRRGWWKGKR